MAGRIFGMARAVAGGQSGGVMVCPFCQNRISHIAEECPACRLSFPRAGTLFGALPRLDPVVSDRTGCLLRQEQRQIARRIGAIQEHFPEVVIQVVVHGFPEAHPFPLHVFWLFNAASFGGESRRGSGCRVILLALDPWREEAALMPGYGLEPFLHADALDHLLELAEPMWQARRWADGVERVLDGLEQLLGTVALPVELEMRRPKEF